MATEKAAILKSNKDGTEEEVNEEEDNVEEKDGDDIEEVDEKDGIAENCDEVTHPAATPPTDGSSGHSGM